MTIRIGICYSKSELEDLSDELNKHRITLEKGEFMKTNYIVALLILATSSLFALDYDHNVNHSSTLYSNKDLNTERSYKDMWKNKNMKYKNNDNRSWLDKAGDYLRGDDNNNNDSTYYNNNHLEVENDDTNGTFNHAD